MDKKVCRFIINWPWIINPFNYAKQIELTVCRWQQEGVSQKQQDWLMWKFTEKSPKRRSQKVCGRLHAAYKLTGWRDVGGVTEIRGEVQAQSKQWLEF